MQPWSGRWHAGLGLVGKGDLWCLRLFLNVFVWSYVLRHACGGQRTAFRSHFPSFIMWGQRIELSCQACRQAHRPISLAPKGANFHGLLGSINPGLCPAGLS